VPEALRAHAHGGVRRSAHGKVLTHRQRKLRLLLLLLCIWVVLTLLTIGLSRPRALGELLLLLLLHQLQVACCRPCGEPRLLLSLGLQQRSGNEQTGACGNKLTA
jgi:hypothetical protein